MENTFTSVKSELQRKAYDNLMNRLKIGLGLTIVLLAVSVAFSFVKASSVETVQVSPLSERKSIINLESRQKFTGSLAITGGSGNDIDFWVTDPQGTTILNLGRVSGGRSFDFTAQSSGAYTFHFGNSFSFLSSKTVTVTYDVGLPTVLGIDFATLITTVAGVIVMLLLLLVAFFVLLNRRKRMKETNQPPQSNQTLIAALSKISVRFIET